MLSLRSFLREQAERLESAYTRNPQHKKSREKIEALTRR